MRYANIVLGSLMVVFAVVQYNDPDPHIWVPIYLWAGAWAFAAAFAAPRFPARPMQGLLALSLVAYAALVVFYWPKAEGFWQQEVWWNDEEAREGMGAMIAFAVLLCASIPAFTARNRRS
jgi:hypothetical protein